MRKRGAPVVPFCRFYFGVSLLKLNGRNMGTLIINGLPGNLEKITILMNVDATGFDVSLARVV